MSHYRPSSLENLSKMEDVAEEKAHRYGSPFLLAIKDFCRDREWIRDTLPQDVTVSLKVQILQDLLSTFALLGLYIQFQTDLRYVTEMDYIICGGCSVGQIFQFSICIY